MVNQQLEEKSSQGLEQDSDGLDDFQVVDSTSEEQRQIEAELDNEISQSEETQAVADVDGERVPMGRDTERQVQPGSQIQAPAKPEVEQPSTTQPQERLFTQAEISKMQSAWMKEIQAAKFEAQKARETYEFNTAVEDQLRQQEEQYAAQYGEDEARKAVRNQQNVAKVRADVEMQQENKRLREQMTQQQSSVEQQAKQIVAGQVMQQFGLQQTDYEIIMSASTPQAMALLGQRLGQQQTQQRQQRDGQRARVPAETRNTSLETGRSTGAAPESWEQKLNRIRQKPSWQWTDDEIRFMRD